MWVNGAHKISVVDSTYRRGDFSFDILDIAAYIDDFRISGLGSSDMVYYIRDLEGNVIAEYDGAGNMLAEYIYGNGQQVAKITPDGQIQYYLNDHPEFSGQVLGSARLLYGSGWRASYYPFGEVAAQAGSVGDNHFDFTGHERNRRIGLLYPGARYYAGAKQKSRMGGNPWLGRWLSVDPLAEEYPA